MLHVPEHEVVDMELRLKGEVSLDGEIVNNDGLTVLETIADDRMNQEELLGEFEQERQLTKQVASAMEGLNDRERYIVEHRITSDNPVTLQDLADRFSISRERVRQIEERTLEKLKKSLLPVLASRETWSGAEA